MPPFPYRLGMVASAHGRLRTGPAAPAEPARQQVVVHHPRAGPLALHPDRMSAAERHAEIAALLAAALVRLLARKSSGLSAAPGDRSLDYRDRQRLHATVCDGAP